MNFVRRIMNILIHPVKTFNNELQNKSFSSIFILACLCGVYTVFDKAAHNGNSLGALILPVAIFISPLWALVFLYITSPLLWISSRLLGGLSSLKDIQYVFTFSSIPGIVSLLLLVPEVIFRDNESFSDYLIYSQSPSMFHSYFISILDILLPVWAIILFVIFNKIANSFSYFKSILSVIIFSGMIALPILILSWIF